LSKKLPSQRNFEEFRREVFAAVDFQAVISECLASFTEEMMVATKQSDESVWQDLEAIVEPAIEWSYSAYQHRHGDVVSSGNMTDKMSIDGIVGMEEVIWSPILGLKGQIDLIAKSLPQQSAMRFIPVEI